MNDGMNGQLGISKEGECTYKCGDGNDARENVLIICADLVVDVKVH